MQFKELKSNYVVYVLDKSSMTCDEAKVVSVSVPRFENKTGVMGMVVDVTLEEPAGERTYVFPEAGQKAYSGDKVFCTEKMDAIADVKAMKKASEKALSEMDRHKEILEKCESLLAELDTEEKAKQQMESRLQKMESRFDNIEVLLKQIANK